MHLLPRLFCAIRVQGSASGPNSGKGRHQSCRYAQQDIQGEQQVRGIVVVMGQVNGNPREGREGTDEAGAEKSPDITVISTLSDEYGQQPAQ